STWRRKILALIFLRPERPESRGSSRCKILFRNPAISRKGSPMATMEAPPRLQVRLHEGAFKNEPFVDFTKEENVRKMRSAIEKVRGQLGREYDLIIGGKRVKTSGKIRSINPAKPSEVVGVHQKAGKEHVEPAV